MKPKKRERKPAGRPRLQSGENRVSTSVSLTPSLRVEFYRLGGSAWLRKAIEDAQKVA